MNNMLVGVFAAIIGAALMNKKLWVGWMTVILGYWLVMSIFIPCTASGNLCIWNTLIVGTLLVMGGLSLRAVKPYKSKNLFAHLKSRDNRIT
ncbi:MAG: hypothetical protein KJN64_12220 [Ignavibacteria bacterium]|nr:hypothetical protein [Ignavibacteria bacterium]NNJ52176.1 hypothetical protein [Ignavibacteriaceae bacterium]NNL21781.1 hypothetical protein [Ignavibacteriaceae bacterium]